MAGGLALGRPPFFEFSGEFLGGDFNRWGFFQGYGLRHLKNMLAFGAANLGTPIWNAILIQVKLCQAFGTSDDHKSPNK
jgi:hypothetical protein